MQRSIQTRKLYSKGMPRHSVKGNSIPKLILRRSKPSFQPSIPNIHLTSKHQLETGAVHCSPLRSSLSHHWQNAFCDSLLITEGSNAPHKMLPNCGCACNKSSSHKSSPDRQTWHMVKTIRNSFKAPKL